MSRLDDRWSTRRGLLPPRSQGRCGLSAVAAAMLVVWLLAGGARAGGGGEANAGSPDVATLSGGARLVVEMRPQAETRGPVVRLGDVVAFVAGDRELWQRIEGIEVGAAPLPGQSRALSRPVVLQRLRQARLDPGVIEWATPVEVSVVTSAAVAVDASRVARAIQAYLTSSGPVGEAGSLQVGAVEMPTDVLVPPGNVEAVVVAGPPIIRPGPAVFAVDVMVDGTPHRRIWVRATLTPAAGGAGGWTPAGSVAAPTALRPDPAGFVEAGGTVRGPISTAADAVGSSQTAPEQAGMVPRGATLTLVVRRGGVTVTVQGTTLEAGTVGQRIRVQNATSGAVLQAVLVGADVAVVDAAPQP